VDIRSTTKADLLALHFDFNGSSGKLIDNSHAIRVNYPHGTSGPSLTVGGKRFYVTQYHFHHPGEELLDGKPFAMVAHFMLEATDGQLAGVAVMLKPGEPNPAVAQLWQHLPATGGVVQDLADVQVSPAPLVPVNTVYYTYTGSLTAPPCTEGVTWFVMKTPVELSAEQIAAFARIYPHNIRPAQPLNGRAVEESR
jgi:carbonic anhydrase